MHTSYRIASCVICIEIFVCTTQDEIKKGGDDTASHHDPTAGLEYFGSGPPPLLYASFHLILVAGHSCSLYYTSFYRTSTENFKKI
jgi:hypothetical protein